MKKLQRNIAKKIKSYEKKGCKQDEELYFNPKSAIRNPQSHEGQPLTANRQSPTANRQLSTVN
jgi:hypothetical protein